MRPEECEVCEFNVVIKLLCRVSTLKQHNKERSLKQDILNFQTYLSTIYIGFELEKQ